MVDRPCCNALAGGRRQMITTDLTPRPYAKPAAYYPGPDQAYYPGINPLEDLARAMKKEFEHMRSSHTKLEEGVQQRLEKMQSSLDGVVEILNHGPTGAEIKGTEEKLVNTSDSKSARARQSEVAHLAGMPSDFRTRKSAIDQKGGTLVHYAQGLEKRMRKHQSYKCHGSVDFRMAPTAETDPELKKVTSETPALRVVRAQGGLNKEKAPEFDTKSFLAPIVGHPYFDSLIASVVMMNSVLVGLQINHDAVRHEEYDPYTYIEYGCTGIFSLELLMRLIVMKSSFCHRSLRLWSAFDVTLVLISWVDVGLKLATDGESLPGPGAQTAKIVKMARMARILRVLRMVKFLAKVRIMAMMIIGSLASLFWLFVLIAGLMYVFALVLTQGCTDWLRPDNDREPIGHESYLDMEDSFGTVMRSMYTLFLSMTSGVSWGEPAKLTQEISGMHWCVFSFFIFFTFFSVLNIVTGVFVDGAIQQANSDRSMRLMQQNAANKEYTDSLLELLNLLDEDESGFITKDEWSAVTTDENVHAHMHLLGVNADDADRLFRLLDTGGDGVISIEEFVDGMSRLRGAATSMDLHMLLSRMNFLIAESEHFFATHTAAGKGGVDYIQMPSGASGASGAPNTSDKADRSSEQSRIGRKSAWSAVNSRPVGEC